MVPNPWMDSDTNVNPESQDAPQYCTNRNRTDTIIERSKRGDDRHGSKRGLGAETKEQTRGGSTSKGSALDVRVELIAPAEAAGLPGTTGDSPRDQAPIPRPKLAHQPAQDHVLLRRPRPLHAVLHRAPTPAARRPFEHHHIGAAPFPRRGRGSAGRVVDEDGGRRG